MLRLPCALFLLCLANTNDIFVILPTISSGNAYADRFRQGFPLRWTYVYRLCVAHGNRAASTVTASTPHSHTLAARKRSLALRGLTEAAPLPLVGPPLLAVEDGAAVAALDTDGAPLSAAVDNREDDPIAPLLSAVDEDAAGAANEEEDSEEEDGEGEDDEDDEDGDAVLHSSSTADAGETVSVYSADWFCLTGTTFSNTSVPLMLPSTVFQYVLPASVMLNSSEMLLASSRLTCATGNWKLSLGWMKARTTVALSFTSLVGSLWMTITAMRCPSHVECTLINSLVDCAIGEATTDA